MKTPRCMCSQEMDVNSALDSPGKYDQKERRKKHSQGRFEPLPLSKGNQKQKRIDRSLGTNSDILVKFKISLSRPPRQ